MPRIPTKEITVNGRKKIVNADDPRAHSGKEKAASSVPQSPADIDAMNKSEVREWLEAHGVEPEKGAKVGDMRDALARIMFMGGE